MKNLILKNKNISQFIKFILIGLLNTLITLSIIFVLFNLFHINYMISNAIGYVCGLINSFLWNKIWTFKSERKFFTEVFLFVLIFIFCYFVNFFLLILLIEYLDFDKNISQLFGMILYTILNFIGNKYFTFKK